MRPDRSSPDGERRRVGALVRDDDELGIAAGEPDLDARGSQLARELEGRLAEQVEEAQVERRAERLAQAAGRLGRGLVTEARGREEVLLDRVDVAVELHRDITMTSLLLSVKGQMRHRRDVVYSCGKAAGWAPFRCLSPAGTGTQVRFRCLSPDGDWHRRTR